MRVVIAGGSGFLGTRLTDALVARGDEVTILTRRTARHRAGGPVTETLWTADGEADASLIQAVTGANAVVNLSGAGIADKRWTTHRKRILRDSRILPTRSLVRAVEASASPPRVFVQGSAVGYYGATIDDRVMDETAPAGDDFLGRLCVEWEHEARSVTRTGCRLVFMRTGIVLAAEGGALPVIARPFRFFVGGRLGSGRQYFPWIHVGDWVALNLWAIDTASVTGPINATAPNPVTNAEFSRALARTLGRPSALPAPGFALRILVGEFADDGLLKGQRVVPARATQLGFRFVYTDVHGALNAIYGT